MRKLSPKQKAFIREYLVDLNATQAAIRAGYSPHRADQIGYENLRKPGIKAAIDKAQKKRADKVKITAEMVVEGLLREATLDGSGSSHAARVAAWEKLGKHLGIFERDNAQSRGLTIISPPDLTKPADSGK